MNSRKQQKKTIESLVITILVLLMFTITMSFAYFTARSSATSNSMTFGTLEVVIEDNDPAFGMSNGVQCAHELMPGCTIYFSGEVNLGTSTIDAFVRLKPKVTITTWNGTTVTRAQATLVLQELVMKAFEKYDFANDQNGNGDWFRPIVSGVPTGNYLYYAGKFIPNDSEAQDGIKLYDFATAGISMPIDATAFGNDWQGCVFNVSLVAQAIQAEHLQYVDSNEELVDLTASDYSSLSNRSAKTAFVNKLAGVSREGENENISVWEELFVEDEEEIEGAPINDLNITTDITIDYEEPEQEQAEAQGAPVPAELLSGNSSSIKSLNGNNYISSKLLSNNQNYYVKVGLNANANVSGTLSIPQYVMYNYNNNTWNRELNPGEYALIYSTQTGNGNQVVYKVVEIGYVPQTQVLVREEVPEVIVLDEDVEKLVYDLISNGFTPQNQNNDDPISSGLPSIPDLASLTSNIDNASVPTAKLLSANNDNELDFSNLGYSDNNNWYFHSYSYITTNYPKTWKAYVIYFLLDEDACINLFSNASAMEDAYNSIILALMNLGLTTYDDFVAGYEQEREQQFIDAKPAIEQEIYNVSINSMPNFSGWNLINLNDYTNIIENNTYIYSSITALKNADDTNHTLYNSWKSFIMEFFGILCNGGSPMTFDSYDDFVTAISSMINSNDDAVIYGIFNDLITMTNTEYPDIWGPTYFDKNNVSIVYGIDVVSNYLDTVNTPNILVQNPNGYGYVYKFESLDLLEAYDQANNTTLVDTWKAFAQDIFGTWYHYNNLSNNQAEGPTVFSDYDMFMEYYVYVANGNAFNPNNIFTSYTDAYIYKNSLDWIGWINSDNGGDNWGTTHLESDTTVDPIKYWMEYYINPSDYVGVLITSTNDDSAIFKASKFWIDTANSWVTNQGQYYKSDDIWEYECYGFESINLGDGSNPYLNFLDYDKGNHSVRYKASYSSYSNLMSSEYLDYWKEFVVKLYEWYKDNDSIDTYQALKEDCLYNYIYGSLSDLLEDDDANHTLYNKWKNLVQEMFTAYLIGCEGYDNISGPATFSNYDDEFVLYFKYWAYSDNSTTLSDNADIYNYSKNIIQSANEGYLALWGKTYYDSNNGMIYGIDVVNNYLSILEQNPDGDGYVYKYETLDDLLEEDDANHTLYNTWKAFVQDVFGIFVRGGGNAFMGYKNLVDYFAYNNNYHEPSDFEKYMNLYTNDLQSALMSAANNISGNGGGNNNDGPAFGSETITSIILPEGITYIPYEAFSGCTILTSITLPSTLEGIDGGAFSGCTSLTSITIPAKVTYLGDNVFNGCTNLSSISFAQGSQIESIGNLYQGNTNITNVVLPDTITYLYSSAFEGCTALESITLPSGITTIPNSAFKDCTSLTSIGVIGVEESDESILPSSVTSIDYNAFYGCTSLESITIPSSVNTIQYSAFEGCTALESVTFTNGLQTLGNSVFKDCTSLTSIIIPGPQNGTTSIGTYVFQNCSALETVVLPSTITTLAQRSGLFDGCTSLRDVTLPFIGQNISNTNNTNANYTLGYIFKTGNSNDNFTGYTKINSYGSYQFIPNSLRSVTILGGPIYASAFSGCNMLTSITIYGNTTIINGSAFVGCTNLTSITLPDSINTIGPNAFKNCTSLTSIDIPSNVTSIGDSAFYGCTALTSITIPENVTTINQNAFKGCSSLTDVIFNGENPSLTTIGIYAFDSCTSLTEIEIPNSVTSIDQMAFQNCTSLTRAVLPSNENYTIIRGGTFNYCTALETVEIPSSVNQVVYGAFYKCSNIKNVYFGGTLAQWVGITYTGTSSYGTVLNGSDLYVKNNNVYEKLTTITASSLGNAASIPVRCFAGCKSLRSVVLSSNIESIGDYAFSNCIGLLSITIPNSVQSIGTYLFSGCYKLVNIADCTGNLTTTSTNPPSTACEIRTDDNFTRCLTYGDKYVTFTVGNKVYLIDVVDTSITTINDLPSTITDIYQYAFNKCKQLESITIPAGVRTIYNNAFEGCTSLEYVNFESNSTLNSISSCVFLNCISLKEIEIPNSVVNIGSEAFRGCSSLISVTLPNNNSFQNLYQYTFLDCISLANITIPNTIISIDYGVFQNCTSLTSIAIPSSVTRINTNSGSYAFDGCINLANVVIDANGENLILGSYIFNGCVSLTSITIPDRVTSIGGSAFNGCTSLANVTLSNNITTISTSAFKNCTSLTSINIPNNVTTIGSSAFEGCTSLTSINISDNVTTIGSSAFNGCTSLASIIIPENVTTIDSSVFYGCTSLTSIIIPDSVISIGSNAFTNCTSLTSVTFENTTNWIILAYSSATSGTAIDVTDAGANVTYLKSTYRTKYWKRTVS